MCLHVYVYETNKNWKFKGRTFYKVLRRTNKTLSSPYFNKRWLPGVNKAVGCLKSKIQVTSNGIPVFVDHGIHVFTSFKKAKACCNRRYKVVKVQADAKDLIAFGLSNEAVFSKVTLTQQEYKRAFNGV